MTRRLSKFLALIVAILLALLSNYVLTIFVEPPRPLRFGSLLNLRPGILSGQIKLRTPLRSVKKYVANHLPEFYSEWEGIAASDVNSSKYPDSASILGQADDASAPRSVYIVYKSETELGQLTAIAQDAQIPTTEEAIALGPPQICGIYYGHHSRVARFLPLSALQINYIIPHFRALEREYLPANRAERRRRRRVCRRQSPRNLGIAPSRGIFLALLSVLATNFLGLLAELALPTLRNFLSHHGYYDLVAASSMAL